MAFYKKVVVAVGTSAAACDPIDLREWEGGRLITGTGITSLTWNESSEKDGTYVAANGDAASTAVAQTGLTAGVSYQIPATLNNAHWLKAVANAAGSITLMLKKTN